MEYGAVQFIEVTLAAEPRFKKKGAFKVTAPTTAIEKKKSILKPATNVYV